MMMPTSSRVPEVFLIEPHPGQRAILDGLKRFNVCRMGRRFGKTVLDVRYLFDYAPRGICAGYRTGWFAATSKIMEDAWLEVKESFGEIVIAKNETLKRLTFLNHATLEFWSLESESVARSRHYGAIVIDEAAHATKLKTQWPRQIRPTLLQDCGTALFSSTPAGKNFFYDLDQRHKTRANWASFYAPSWANPYLLREEIEDARLDSTSLEFRQEYGAEYVDFSGSLVRPDWCQTGQPAEPCPIVLGVDLAISSATDADYTAIVAMSRHALTGKLYVRGAVRGRWPFVEILRQITMAATRYQPVLIVIEETQFQAAVVQELLRTTKLPVVGYKPDKDKYTRFLPIAARYEQMLVYHDPDLPPDFQDEILSFTGNKDDHDDYVDALSMAYRGISITRGPMVSSAGHRETQEQAVASYMQGMQ